MINEKWIETVIVEGNTMDDISDDYMEGSRPYQLTEEEFLNTMKAIYNDAKAWSRIVVVFGRKD